MYLCHTYVGLPVALLYSLITSFFLLSYFQNKEKTNIILFYIGVVHLSSLFLMPIMCITIVLLPTEDLFLQYNDKLYFYIINIISYANHALNKVIYPFIKIYYESGYISTKDKFMHISLKDWIIEFSQFLLLIIGIIVFLILGLISEKYSDIFVFLLNYLNILDLIKVYLEISYSIGNLTLYYNKVFKLNEEYKYFIIGKISIYRRKKLESFKKNFKTLYQYNLTYIEHNPKFNYLSEIPSFINKIKSEEYLKKEELEEIEPLFIDEKMNKKTLENLVCRHYKKCKNYYRKLDRIKNVEEDVLGQKEQINNEKFIYKLFRKIKSRKCEKYFFYFFVFLCLLIFLQDIYLNSSKFKKVNVDEYCNSTSVYNDIEQDKDLNGGFFPEFISCLIIYPIIYLCLNIATGIYIIPMLYSLINRRSLTGNFLYAKNSSDTIDLIESLGNITEMIFPSIYLSSVLYGMIFYSSSSNEKKIEFDVDCLTFFQIPNFEYIFYYKYIPFLIFIIIMRYFESINLKCIKCLKLKIHISDECYFDPRKIDSCFQPCYKERRLEYIDEGRKVIMGNKNSELNQKLISYNNNIIVPTIPNNINYNNSFQ